MWDQFESDEVEDKYARVMKARLERKKELQEQERKIRELKEKQDAYFNLDLF